MSRLLLLLQLTSLVSVGLACDCDRYPWSAWSACSQTCNHGTQHRQRAIRYDEFYWKYSCHQICQSNDRRACNDHACPINCLLTEFGPWSDCSPCAKKQLRTRSVQRPSQFGGSPCSVELTEDRPCFPSKECKIEPINCKDNFQCANGRCINSTLTCNRQNDCEDNSDERDCGDMTIVCAADKPPPPGINLLGNGFDAIGETQKAAVLANMFMGGTCIIKRPESMFLYYRIPHNFENFHIKVGEVQDFSTQPQTVHTEPVEVKRGSSSGSSSRSARIGIYPFYIFSSNANRLNSNREAFQASKKSDSMFFRVHQVLPVSTFTVRDPSDLVLSGPFLKFLHALPLDYNYPLYREIFQHFGTHYYSSGSLGGRYDMLYQYSREDVISSGETKQQFSSCLSRDSTWTVILYTQHSSVTRCKNKKMTEKHQGSFMKSSKKSFSQVRGGRIREAEALSFEQEGPSPNKETFKNWAKSVIDNPDIVDYKLSPIIDLVRGIPCAVTKRRHLKKALLQYLDDFDTCKCAPCPNNAKPVLSGTDCKCVCQTGTFGENCETRAPDYTSEDVDGYWSCWGPWSRCSSTMKRHRSRRCDNPSPLRGGQPCQGPNTDEDPCYISIFQKQETCDNDDDFTVGWIDKLPPGVQGCRRPKSPANSFLRKAKQYYNFGEDEEFECHTGFELEGFQYIYCRPDETWTEPTGSCIRKICLPPEIPDGMRLFPIKEEYRVDDTVLLSCEDRQLRPLPSGSYKCSNNLIWDPPLPADLRCTDEQPFVPGSQCQLGQTLQNSQCVCISRESCLAHPDSLCVLNQVIDTAVSMSLCSFHAGRCHGDPLFFLSDGACSTIDPGKLEWAKFRAKLASKSSVKETCDLDTCYEWETCSESKKCVCKAARDCARGEGTMFCVKLTISQRTRSLDLCSIAALKCASYQLEILNEGECPSR